MSASPDIAPPQLSTMLDALIAAFRALGPGHRVSLTDHGGWLHVAIQTPDSAGPEAVARACEALGAPPPECTDDGKFRWRRSEVKRGAHMAISITGDWQVVRCAGRDCDDDTCEYHNSCRACGNEIAPGRTLCGAMECGGEDLPR